MGVHRCVWGQQTHVPRTFGRRSYGLCDVWRAGEGTEKLHRCPRREHVHWEDAMEKGMHADDADPPEMPSHETFGMLPRDPPKEILRLTPKDLLQNSEHSTKWRKLIMDHFPKGRLKNLGNASFEDKKFFPTTGIRTVNFGSIKKGYICTRLFRVKEEHDTINLCLEWIFSDFDFSISKEWR